MHGEPEKRPLCLIENLSCSKGVTCAFQVTSTWVSYSSRLSGVLGEPLLVADPAAVVGGETRLWDKPADASLYSTFALSHFSSSMARMRSRSLISCTPQYVINQMDKVLTGKPRRWRETWSLWCSCLPNEASSSPALLPLRWVWEVPQVHDGKRHFPLCIQPYSFTEGREKFPGSDFR